MNLLTNYSLVCGQKISNIDIYEKFYPLPFENKYIVIQPFSKGSKSYGYWDEVLALVLPKLTANNYYIVQVGNKDEIPLQECFHTQGSTSINQVAYLIKNCSLFLGVDSFGMHLAGNYDIPRVGLYSNNYTQNVAPFFGSKEKEILLEPDRTTLKPCFGYEDPLRQIDTITPEQIANSIFKLLNIDFQPQYETLLFGQFYNTKLIETIPDQVFDPRQFGIESIIVRMDFKYDPAILFQQLNVSKCSVITDKTIDLKMLSVFKQNIQEIVYEITETHDPKWVEEIRKLGIRIVLITKLPEEKIQDIKLDYIEIGLIIQKKKQTIDDFPKLKEQNPDNLFFKTAKILLSSGKIYPSYAHYLQGISIPDMTIKPVKIINDTTFWTEQEHFYVLKKELTIN